MQAHGRQPPILAVWLFLKILVRCPTVLQANVSLSLDVRSKVEVERDVDLVSAINVYPADELVDDHLLRFKICTVVQVSIRNQFIIEEFVSAGCCILIFISNVAVLFLLERMEYAASEREQLLTLNQQIQLQSKNMTSASELYSAQRKKVHDFRAHLNVLNQLMKSQEYSAAEEYLGKITEQQTDRLFLVNTHHPILDALFNTKAAEATQKKISIDFEVNDLSNLPFDASDIVVLLSNLLDNAIEACQRYDKGDKTIHVMAVAQQDFFISVRNTSEPVTIINSSIPTTKPEPQLHGFGLANIRLILEKYSGEYTMFYENGWFQFTADIPLTPIS